MTTTPTGFDRLAHEWSSEGPRGVALWAADWALWKSRLYYALPGRTAENVQARFRHARRIKKYGINDPIIVYQMGKVGSSSMYRSLEALQLNVPIYHLHYLNDADSIGEWAKKTLRVYDRELKMVALANQLKHEIEIGRAPRYNLVSLVRAPIPRNLSTFFHHVDSYYPNFVQDVEADTVSFQKLADFFVNGFVDPTPERWFDRQVRDVFGLDVYAEPFPREREYQIYENDKARLLVIRLEGLNRVAAPAMGKFLNIPVFRLVPANVGEKKKYGAFYKRFLESLCLPQEFVEATNETEYARHFYTEQELAASVAQLT